MAFIVDKNADISLIQGDSGTFVVNGIPTDKNYTVYFGIRDKDRKPIGNELVVNSNYSSKVIFYLTGEFTNLLTVPKDEYCEVYFYGVKICSEEDNMEDTLSFASGEIGGVNTITVYPKKVEGV